MVECFYICYSDLHGGTTSEDYIETTWKYSEHHCARHQIVLPALHVASNPSSPRSCSRISTQQRILTHFWNLYGNCAPETPFHNT